MEFENVTHIIIYIASTLGAITTIITVLSKVVKKLTNNINKNINGFKQKLENNNEALGVILHQKLDELYNKYMNKESITTYDKISFKELYERYTALGFNHVSEDMLRNVDRLKVVGGKKNEI